MKKIIFIKFIFLISSNLFAGEGARVLPKGWFVESLIPAQGNLSVTLSNKREKKKKFYSLNIKTFEIQELNEDKVKKDYLNTRSDKITYSLNKCKSIDEKYLSEESSCESLTINVNEKKYNLVRGEFYKWESFIDPVLWGDNLYFKRHVPRNLSGDTGIWEDEKINGIQIVDLKELSFKTKLRGAFVTFLSLDKENLLLWVGSEYGIYAFDKDFKEIISCAFPNDLKRIGVKEFSFVCGNADYVLDNKFDQSRMLIEKHNAIKQGKKPPEDSAKNLDEAVKKLLKKKEKRYEDILFWKHNTFKNSSQLIFEISCFEKSKLDKVCT